MRTEKLVPALFGFAVILALAGAAAADIETGLIGYWPLDGDAQDATGNELHGVINGGVVPAPDRLGYPDSAMMFPGDAASNIAVADSPLLNITGEMTLAAWVFLNSGHTNNSRIIAKSGGGARSWSLNVENDIDGVRYPPTLQIGINGGAGNISARDTQSLPTGEWVHMAGVYRPGEVMEVYVNGELRATNAAGIPATQHSDNKQSVMIGARNACGNCGWNGFIDEARVYARALSAEEIGELQAFVPSPRVRAWNPDPADGATDVLLPLLQWKPGVTAVLHDVYIGSDPNLGPDDLAGSHLPLTMHFYTGTLTPGTTYYWRVDEVEADLTTVHTGDVWSFTAKPFTAHVPSPADGDKEVSTDPNLTLAWQAGREAIRHQVYFGAGLADVNEGAAATDKGKTTKTSFVVSDALEPLTSYYWRVDQIGATGTVWTGEVWDFATFRTVDDFEDYTDDEGSRIYQTWVDGYTTGTNNSVVGNLDAPFAERVIVHAGSQSMPIDYNNLSSPYYSEAERTWTPVEDWTADGADTLVLYVRGRAANGAEHLYLVLEDSAGKTGTALYPDSAVFTSSSWIRWKIPLSVFRDAGVNLTRIEKVYIGIGSRTASAAGGAGRVYIDDIRLTKP